MGKSKLLRDHCREHGWVSRRQATALLVIGLAGVVGACTQHVRLPEKFPTPVTEQLPLRIGLYQDRPFRDYVHQDASRTGETWIIDLRSIHKTFFQTVLAALFAELIEVEQLTEKPEPSVSFDAVIEPQVQTFTLQTPSAAGSAAYRASVVYLLNIYSSQGELLASWPVEGQGQGHAGWLQAEQGVTEAVRNALRDVAAQIVTAIADNPTISKLLVDQRAQDVDTSLPTDDER